MLILKALLYFALVHIMEASENPHEASPQRDEVMDTLVAGLNSVKVQMVQLADQNAYYKSELAKQRSVIEALELKVDTIEKKLDDREQSADSQLATFSVAFSVYANRTRYYDIGDTVIFDEVITNLGEAYDTEADHFLCPVSGVYVFTASMAQSRTEDGCDVTLMLNDVIIGGVTVDGSGLTSDQGSVTVVTECAYGDLVYARVGYAGEIYGWVDPYTVFTGFLLDNY